MLWTTPLGNDSQMCPDGFEYVIPTRYKQEPDTVWANLLDATATEFRFNQSLLCLQWRRDDIKFIKFTPGDWEREETFIGPKAQSQHVSHLEFDISKVPKDFPIIMQSQLLDFGAQYISYNDYDIFDDSIALDPTEVQLKTSCNYTSILNQTETCGRYFQGLIHEKLKIVDPFEPSFEDYYWNQRGLCIDQQYCAAPIRMGSSQCQSYIWDRFWNIPKQQNESCLFTVYFAVYPPVPEIYQFFDFWIYNIIGFVPVLFFWLFITYYYGRKMQYNYLQHYYVSPPSFELKEGGKYVLKLLATAKPFTSYQGTLEIRDNDTHATLGTFPLSYEFDSEDIQDSKLSSIKKQLNWTCPKATGDASFSMKWSGEFETSNFATPLLKVVMYKKFPFGVQSAFNVFFMPFMFWLQIHTNIPARSKFIRFWEYAYLSLYFTCVNGCLLLPLLYQICTNIVSMEYVFWGTASSKPVVPVVAYAIFLLFQVISVALALAQLLCKHSNITLSHTHNVSQFFKQQLGHRDNKNFFLVSHHRETSTNATTAETEDQTGFDQQLISLDLVTGKSSITPSTSGSTKGTLQERRQSRFFASTSYYDSDDEQK